MNKTILNTCQTDTSSRRQTTTSYWSDWNVCVLTRTDLLWSDRDETAVEWPRRDLLLVTANDRLMKRSSTAVAYVLSSVPAGMPPRFHARRGMCQLHNVSMETVRPHASTPPRPWRNVRMTQRLNRNTSTLPRPLWNVSIAQHFNRNSVRMTQRLNRNTRTPPRPWWNVPMMQQKNLHARGMCKWCNRNTCTRHWECARPAKRMYATYYTMERHGNTGREPCFRGAKITMYRWYSTASMMARASINLIIVIRATNDSNTCNKWE